MNAFAAMAAPPPLISSPTASSSLRWPLRDPARSMPPMHYLRMEELTELRSRAAAAAAGDTSQCRDYYAAWMNNVPEATSALFKNEEVSRLRYDYTILSLAVLLLGHSYTDEAHALVTPYSWPDEIHTSFGPVRYHDSDPGVVSTATYVHSLVHRREGWHIGELGMMGWSNADYWGNAWYRPYSRSTELQELWRDTIANIRGSIRDLARDNPAGKEWCEQNLPEATNDGSNGEPTWDLRALHRLCAHVTKDNVSGDMVEFAEGAVKAELRALFSHCQKLAGYSTTV